MYTVYFEMYYINMKCYYNEEKSEKKKDKANNVELCSYLRLTYRTFVIMT